MLLDAHIEGRQGAAVLLGGIEQHRLIHGDSYGQPRPKREQLWGRNRGRPTRGQSFELVKHFLLIYIIHTIIRQNQLRIIILLKK